jgi:O-antigen/teichoic acid export membrane protein
VSGPSEPAQITEAQRRELVGVAKGGGLNLAGSVFNQAARFLVILLLVRLLGAATAGLFFQAYAVFMILSTIATAGFVNSVTRYVAVHRADGDPASLRGTVRLGLWGCTGLATVLAIGLVAASSWLSSDVFGDPEMAGLLRWMAVALPAAAFTDVALSATQGFKTMRAYASINLVFEPATRLGLTATLIAAGFDLGGAVAALVVTNVAAAILSARALRRLMGPPAVPARYIARELLSFSAASWFSNLASNWLMWADTILLGAYLGPAQVSAYQVASRLALLGAVVIGPFGTSFAPVAADLYRRGQLDGLRRAYAAVTSWSVRLYLPAFVVLVVFREELLAIFGPAFVLAASVVVILAVAQLVNTATGPCGYLITMSGHIRVQLVLNVAALVTNVALNLWLIPRRGIEGAALAWAVCIAGFTLIRLVYVRRTMAMWPFDERIAKAALAGAAALVTALVVRGQVAGTAGVALGIVASVGAYVGALLLAGLGEEDRLVLTSLRRRLRLGGA